MSSTGRHRPSPPREDPTDLAMTVEERLLGKPASMVRRDVSRGAGVSSLSGRKFWHALGFPVMDDEEPAFTEADLLALSTIARIVREDQLDETTALAMTRAFARTMDRLAVWQTQLMAEAMGDPALEADLDEADSRAVPDLAAAEAAADTLARLADDLEPILVYAWRRHIASAITRMLADSTPDGAQPAGVRRVVGFADLVSFTTMVRRLSERQLAVMVQRFEGLASDIVTAHGGRVIKTVGDEILFVTREAAPAAAIALDLVDIMGEDDLLPDVRVGMAFGPCISRLGDVFGITVNRASRITSVAGAGRVLVDDALAARLGDVSGFEMTTQRRRVLRGIGPVTPSELRRAPGARRATWSEDL